jgi:hypothetical protein
LPFIFLTLNNHVFNAVELAPGVDPEALEVAKDCLESIFSVNSSVSSEAIQPGLLLELFASLEANERDRARAALLSQSVSNNPSQNAGTSNVEEDSNKCTTSNVCSLSPHSTHEFCFCLTTILSVLPHRHACLFIFRIY